ncbi:MAG: NAD-dependent epimerase/dehydratase family protein [Devosia sp.]
MSRRVFVAGATGAIGLPLCRLLVADGWAVTGMTRRSEKAGALAAIGVQPVVVDVYEAEALRAAVVAAAPDVVVHQLTDLPPGLDPTLMAAARVRNTRIRDEGTRNLIAAAVAAGAGRLVLQSLGFAYAPGPKPFSETSAIDPAQTGVLSLEIQAMAAPIPAVVLRYGRLYGPGTGFAAPHGAAPVHVDAAADAARRALEHGAGIYNIAESDGEVSSVRAAAELGWRSDFRSG